MGFYEDDLYKSVKLNPEIYDVLQRLNGKGSIHHIIHDNLVLSFYLTGVISIEKEAHLLEIGIVEFIGMLDFYQLPWTLTYDGNPIYQQTSDHLLEMVDNMIEITK